MTETAQEYKLNGRIITDLVIIELIKKIMDLEQRVLELETNPLPVHDHPEKEVGSYEL